MSIRNYRRFLTALFPAAGFAALLAAGLLAPVRGDDLDKRLQDAEAKRVALIEQVKKPVIAVLAPGGQGGGSGVLITDDGYALTNFHVAAAIGSYFHCGLSNGEMYDAVLVGLDRAGDLALIKLIQKKDREVKFPVATLGDSDKLQPGDWTLAMGNPLLLATDFNPTVTYGMVSGTHRYQKIPHPTGTLLEYCDCIQVDTAVNPGNSGGPLFNMQGEFVGINSAGSLGKSDRINSGAAYSISVNMIKNFLGELRAGLECDHATLGADIEPENEEGGVGRLIVKRVVTGSEVDRRGLSVDDQLVSFAGWPLTNINQYKNKLGIYPKGWREPLVFRHETTDRRDVLVRLPGRRPDVIPDKRTDNPMGDAETAPPPLPPPPPGTDAAKLYERKLGYANYYFNKLEQKRLLDAFHAKGDFSGLRGDWTLKAACTLGKKTSTAQIAVKAPTKEDKSEKVVADIDLVGFTVDPLSTDTKLEDLVLPPGSGGLLVALYQYRQLLAFGDKGFSGEFSHGGVEPFYPPLPGDAGPDYTKQRVMCEVLRTRLAGAPAKWYFSKSDGSLLGFEVAVDRDDDPCEVYLSEYHQEDGRSLPGRMEVRYKDKTYAVLNGINWKLEAAK
jgi:S1-C subfamily serine protease